MENGTHVLPSHLKTQFKCCPDSTSEYAPESTENFKIGYSISEFDFSFVIYIFISYF